MGQCKDCRHWSLQTFPHGSMELSDSAVERGYGHCLKAEEDPPEAMAPETGMMRAKYDGGYYGELITHGEFGCVLFKRD